MSTHCPQCRGAEYEWDSLTRKQLLVACPGCQECASNERRWLKAAEEAREAEAARLRAVGKRGDAQAAAARCHALVKRMCIALGISTDMDDQALVGACERLRSELESERKEAAYWCNTEARILARDNIALRAEILSVRESLQRERAGQVKCNSGHVSDRALWDCPVCVEAMRGQLSVAKRMIKKIGADEDFDEALAAWEGENG